MTGVRLMPIARPLGSGLLRAQALNSIFTPCSSHTNGATCFAVWSAGRLAVHDLSAAFIFLTEIGLDGLPGTLPSKKCNGDGVLSIAESAVLSRARAATS